MDRRQKTVSNGQKTVSNGKLEVIWVMPPVCRRSRLGYTTRAERNSGVELAFVIEGCRICILVQRGLRWYERVLVQSKFCNFRDTTPGLAEECLAARSLYAVHAIVLRLQETSKAPKERLRNRISIGSKIQNVSYFLLFFAFIFFLWSFRTN